MEVLSSLLETGPKEISLWTVGLKENPIDTSFFLLFCEREMEVRHQVQRHLDIGGKVYFEMEINSSGKYNNLSSQIVDQKSRVRKDFSS